MQELGWIDGRNIRTDTRWAAGNLDLLRDYAAELLSVKPDLLIGFGTPTVAALQQATRSVPIVFISANDPVGSGFVASLAHPGGNITGFIDLEATIGGKWVELVKEMAPHVKQIAALYNPQTHTGQFFKSMETASQSLAVRIIHARFKDASDIDTAFAEFAPEPNSGLIVMPDTSTALHRVTIIVLATRYQLPALYPRRYFINEGGVGLLWRVRYGFVSACSRVWRSHPQGR